MTTKLGRVVLAFLLTLCVLLMGGLVTQASATDGADTIQDSPGILAPISDETTAPAGDEGDETTALTSGDSSDPTALTSGDSSDPNALTSGDSSDPDAPASEGGSTPGLRSASPTNEGGDEESTPPPQDPGEEEREEEYAVPAGSATIALTVNETALDGLDSTHYVNDTANNAIENALRAAVDQLTIYDPVNASGSGGIDIRITVSKGNYEGGLDLTATGGTLHGEIRDAISILNKKLYPSDSLVETPQVAPYARIAIVAEGAMDADGDCNANTGGEVALEGDLLFEGFDVLLAGIYLSLNNRISASNAESFEYYGTALDDNVTIEVSDATELTVDTGGGDDRVDLTVKQRPSTLVGVNEVDTFAALVQIAEIPLERSKDAVLTGSVDLIDLGEDVRDAAMAAVNKIRDEAEAAIREVSGTQSTRVNTELTIHTGDGDDDIALRMVNSTSYFMTDSLLLSLINPATAEQYPLFGLRLDMGSTDLSVDLGDGADSFHVTGGTDSMFGSIAMKAIGVYTDALVEHSLMGADEAKRELLKSSLHIKGGAGDDRISVDTTAAYHSMFGIKVDVDGGEGFDRTHLSGTLDEDEAEASRITGDADKLTLRSQASISVGLFNKEDKDKYGDADFSMQFDTLTLHRGFDVKMTGVDAVSDLLRNKPSVTLSSANTTRTSADRFTDYILAQNLVDSGVFHITFNGGDALMANLLLRSDEKVALKSGSAITAPGLNVFLIAPSINVSGAIHAKNVILIAESLNSKALDASRSVAEDELSEDGVEIGFDLVEAKEEAHISIDDTGSIRAAGMIDMSASTLQTGGFIDVSIVKKVDIPQFIIVKIGSAVIDIRGKLTADGGYVRAVSDTFTEFDTRDILALIPVSFAWAETASKVTLGGNAKIIAGAGVALRSDSQLYVISYDKGSFPLFNISIAANIALADTKTIVKDESEITAGGDLRVDARSRIIAYAMSVSAPTDIANQKAKGGVFIGGSFALAETQAHVVDNAKLSSGGAVRVEADGILYTKTYAISSPVSSDAVDEDGEPLKDTQTIGITSAVSMIEQILGYMPKETDGIGAKLVGGITGSNSFAQKFSTGTNETDAATSPSLQLLGAFAIAYINNEISALIETARTVTAGKALHVRAWGETTSRQRADGSLFKNSGIAVVPGLQQTINIENDPTNAAAGVGVTVGVFKHTITARILKGAVSAAQGLAVTANSRRVEASAVSKSGHIPASASFGLGGAVTVHIVAVKSEARLANTAHYKIEGPITVDASMAGKFETVGDASGKRVRAGLNLGIIEIPLLPPPTYQQGGAGVGAGIAVAVTGIDVSAVIEDGIDFKNGAPHGEVNVTAAFTGTEDVFAAAGAAGGISVTPVSATLITGVMCEAYLGEGPEAQVDGGFTVMAKSSMVRTLGADAAAAGAAAGMGAAVAVAVVNDSATAEVKRKVKAAGNVRVEASSISRMSESSKASTGGAVNTDSGSSSSSSDKPATEAEQKQVAEGKAEGQGKADNPDVQAKADKTADEKIENGQKLAGDVNTKNTNSDSVKKQKSKRQSFQTGEGSIQVAAAMAVNIHDNLSMAKVYDGLDVIAGGDVSILSRIDTDAVVKASAGTTDSLFGVGVGAAVNVVTSKNIAYMGTGVIKGRSLTVAAEIYEKAQYNTLQTAFNKLLHLLANAGYMDVVIKNARDDSYKDSTVYKLQQLLNKSSLSDKEKAELAGYVSEMIDLALWVEGNEVTLRDKINEKIIDTDGVSIDHAYAMEQYVRAYLAAHYTKDTAPSNADYYALLQTIIQELIAAVDGKKAAELENYAMIELALDCAEGKTLSANEKTKLARFLGVKDAEINTENAKMLRQFVVDQLIGKLSGGDAASAAASIFADSFEAVLESFMEYLCDPDTWMNMLKLDLSTGVPRLKLNLDGSEYFIELEEIGEQTYAALVALLSSRFGSGSELDGVGHLISTQAVSGVGASGVGVAGAAAITVANMTSSATVQNVAEAPGEEDYNVDVTGDIRIEADEAYKAYTTASGSSDKSLGQAAKLRTVGTAGSAVGVGASFSMNMLDSDVSATLGLNRSTRARSLALAARLRNDIDTVSVAGSDPIARRDKAQLYTPTFGDRYRNIDANSGTNTKGIAADASVALAIVKNRVIAVIAQGGRVVTTGSDTVETLLVDKVNPLDPEDVTYKKANVYVQAIQQGDTYTESKAFAAGSRVSVGVTVAASFAESEVAAGISAPVNSYGSVRVFAMTADTDELMVLATSVGGDIDRILEKFREGLNYVSPGASETSNLSGTITNELNRVAGPASQKGKSGLGKLLGNLPLSSNILKAFNIDLDSESQKAQDSSKKANKQAEGAGAPKVAPQEMAPSPSISVAAAVGVAHTKHEARAIISAPITALGDVDAIAENRANFRVRASGASVSATMVSANSVAAAAAIAINKNRAEVRITGDINASNGDVRINALSTQNMDGNYPGYLAAQAVAGSIAVGGVMGLFNVAGAVAVVSDFADTVARLAANVIGKSVSVTAYDKSKLSLRASAVSAGNQLTGVGATFALLYAESDISARVADGVLIQADSLTVTAERAVVDQNDYVFPFSWANLFTVAAPGQDILDKDKGLVHLTLPPQLSDISSFEMEVTIGVDKIVDMLDLLNYFASVNYYVEALSASFLGGMSPAMAAAGGVAMLLAQNNVEALIGDNVTLLLTNTGGKSLTLDASSDATSRLVAGSVASSFSTAGAAGGMMVAAAYLEDTVNTGIGVNGDVSASGDVKIAAGVSQNVWDITVAAAASSGGALGGVLNAVIASADAIASVGDGTHFGAETAPVGSFTLRADNDASLTYISFSMAASAGATGGVAGGGTLGVILNENSTEALLGNDVQVYAGDILLLAESGDSMLSVLSGDAVAGSGASAAGTIGVLINSSRTRAEAGARAALLAKAGQIQLLAHNSSDLFFAMLTVSASGGGVAAVGASVNTHIFDQEVTARVGSASRLEAGIGNVLVEALAKNDSVDVTFAGGATGGTAGIAGAIVTIVSKTRVTAEYGDAVFVKAGDSVGAVAQASGSIISVTGGVAGGSTVGVGATVHTLVVKNAVSARAGDYVNLIGLAATNAPSIGGLSQTGIRIKTPNRDERRRGVVFSATGGMNLIMGSVSGAIAGNVSVAGVASTSVVKNTVEAGIGENAKINTSSDSAGPGAAESGELSAAAGSGSAQSLTVEADGETELIHFAGSLSAAGSVGVGATVVTQVFGGSTEAVIGDGLTAFCAQNASITANTGDEALLTAISFGGGGSVGVGVGASVLVFENRTYAGVGGSIQAGGDITILATSSTKLINTAAAATVGGSVAASPVAIVTYFQGSTEAELTAGGKLIAAGAVKLWAKSIETVIVAAAGASAAGSVAVSGTVSVAVTKLRTSAVAGDGTIIRGRSVSVLADDSFSVLSTAGSLSASGTGSASVTAVVNIIKNTVAATVGAGGELSATVGDAEVIANSVRELASYAVTASGAGVAGVGATIMVNVIGAKLSKDAADGLLHKTYTEDGVTKSNGGLKIDDLMGGFSNDPDAQDSIKRLSVKDDLTPDNGDSVKDYQVGDEDGVDVAAGYKDPQLDSADGAGNEGESYAADGTGNEDLAQAANMGQVQRAYEPMDAVCALIGANTRVTAAGDILIEASDLLTADAIAGTVAVGGTAGVGAGLALVISYSNVIARAESGAVLDAGGTVTVKASGSSKEVTGANESKQAKDTGEGLAEALEEAVTGHGIRAISITAAGGLVGVSVSAAVITLDSNVIAELNGSVTRAAQLSVLSVTEHTNILAATLAASGGAVSVSVPVAVVRSVGEAISGIGGSGVIKADGKVTVKGVHTLKGLAAAASFGAGSVSVNASLPLAINRMTSHTYIGRGVNVEAGSVELTTVAVTAARALLVGVSVGANVSVGVGVAIAMDEATIYTYAGETPGTNKKPNASALYAGLIKTRGGLTVMNSISSEACPDILYFSGGAVNITANVLLAFNRLDAVAAINKINVDAGGAIQVSASMRGEATARLYKAGMGGYSVGAAVGYAQMKASNQALIDLDGVTVKGAGALTIRAGSSSARNAAYASAETTSANISVLSVSLNAAVADNHALNTALIQGSGTLELMGLLTVESWLYAAANASLTGLDISALRVTAGVVLANNRAENRAEAYAGKLRAAGLTVRANMDSGKYAASALATITQGLGTLDLSLANAAVNVAIAYSRIINTARAGAATMKLNGGALSLRSDGTAKAAVDIKNLALVNLSYYSAGAMTGYAYAQGEFIALLELGGGSVLEAGSIEVISDYSASADAAVQPSMGGVKVSAASVDINMAVAAVTTKAHAGILRAGSGGVRPSIRSAGNVSITALGGVNAAAKVTTANLSFGAVEIGVNLVFARAAGDQRAELRNVAVTATGSVNVISDVNRSKTGAALATVGAAGGKNVKVSAMSGRLNVANATNSQKSKASVALADISAGSSLIIRAVSDVNAKADVETPSTLSLMNVALNTVVARSAAELRAELDISTAAVSAPLVYVEADYENDAQAVIAPSGSISGALSYTSTNANLGIADATTKAVSCILGGGTLSSTDEVRVFTRATGGALAKQKRVNFSLSVYNISMNTVSAKVSDNLTAAVSGNGVYELNKLRVMSFYAGDGAQAETGGAGGNKKASGSISLVGVDANSAFASAAIRNTAFVSGGGAMTMNAASVEIDAQSDSRAEAQALSYEIAAGVLSIGNLIAKGAVNGNTSAAFGGGSFRIRGDVSVKALDTPSLYLNSQLPGLSISGIKASSSIVSGSIGTAAKPNSVSASLNDGTTLHIEDGDLLVQARNLPEQNKLIIDNGVSVAIVGVTVSALSSDTRLKTTATLGKDSQLLVFGQVTVSAEDKPKADNSATGTSISIAISADIYYANNLAQSTVTVALGENLKLIARGDIHILAKTSAELSAITNSDSDALFEAGKLQSRSTILRNVRISGGDNVELSSLSGSISLRTASGESDNIETKTLDSTKNLLGISSVEAVTTVDIDQAIDLNNGYKIIAYVGDVTLENAVSLKKLVNYAESKTSCGYKFQRAEAKTNITIRSNLTLGKWVEEVVGGLPSALQGYNVRLLNWLKKADVDNQVNVANDGFSGTMDPFCRIDLNFQTMKINGYFAGVHAYEKFHLNNVGYDTTLHGNNDVRLYNRAYLDLPLVSVDWLEDVISKWTKDRKYNDDAYTRIRYNFDTYMHHFYVYQMDYCTRTGFFENTQDGSTDRYVMTSEIYFDTTF